MSIFKLQLILFIILLALWNIFTPVLEGADEIGHYCHADYIAHRNKLPDLTKIDGCFLWHPPLYYVLLAPIVKIFSVSEFKKEDFVKNPNFDQLKHGQYSQYVHNKDELLFKWDKKVLQVHTMRLFSSMLGILMFIITWKMSKYVFKNQLHRNVSLLLFFNPMFIHIFSTLSNVALISLITTVLIALDIKYENKNKGIVTTFLEGILLGLGFITKITIVNILFAKAYLYIKEIVKKPKITNLKLKDAAIITAGFLVAAGWYILRSKKLYGSILERDVIARMPTEYQHEAYVQSLGYINYINSFFTTVFRTFWSGYGAITIQFPNLLNLILLFFTLVLIYTVIKKYKNLNPTLRISVIYVLSIFIGLMVNNLKLRAMHAKDLFPAYMPLSFLFSFALIKTPEVIKNIKYNSTFQIISFFILTYFFAQEEIVKIVKFTFGKIGINAQEELGPLFMKILIVLIVIQISKFLLGRISVTKKVITSCTFGLFLIDAMILAFSSYLFYFRFL